MSLKLTTVAIVITGAFIGMRLSGLVTPMLSGLTRGMGGGR